MEAKNRIIVALDCGSLEQAYEMARTLYHSVGGFKVGLELLTREGGPKVVEKIRGIGGGVGHILPTPTPVSPPALFNGVFYDGKFMDIPNTVAGAARGVTRLRVGMFNVHCLGGFEMMQAALKAAEEETISMGDMGNIRPLVLGVTILTSLNYASLKEMGFFESVPELSGPEWTQFGQGKVQELVLRLASLAQKAGLDGVIASAKEATAIRESIGKDFLIVTPGIRPTWSAAGDQKRITTPADAIKAGADYLVIGRPITNPPTEIGTPVEAVKRIIDEISSVL